MEITIRTYFIVFCTFTYYVPVVFMSSLYGRVLCYMYKKKSSNRGVADVSGKVRRHVTRTVFLLGDLQGRRGRRVFGGSRAVMVWHAIHTLLL
jgi:hypothetical protein